MSSLCLNVIHLEEGKRLIFLPKGLKHNWHKGGGAVNFNDDYDDFDEDNDDDSVLSSSKHDRYQGGPINYDDDDDNDDDGYNDNGNEGMF